MKKLLLIALLIVGCDNATEPEDCAGVSGGDAVEDCAGVCEGDTTQEVCDECSSLVFDCAGLCDGSAVVGGCDNTCGSTAVVDECGVCGGSGMQTTYTETCDDEYICQDVQVSSQVDNYGYYCSYSCIGQMTPCDPNNDSCRGSGGCSCSYYNIPETVYEWVTQCDWVTDCDTETVTSCP